MSRAFVKEGTGELEPLPDLPISAHPNYVTPRGLADLRARLVARAASQRAGQPSICPGIAMVGKLSGPFPPPLGIFLCGAPRGFARLRACTASC